MRVTDAALLGEGGEARVFRFENSALKVFHTIDEVKRRKLAGFPQSLPSAVRSPEELLLDVKGNVIGYRMALVPGAVEFSRLANRKWRAGVISSGWLADIFGQLHAVVRELHAAGVIIGDFNDGNVLLADDGPSPQPSPRSAGRGSAAPFGGSGDLLPLRSGGRPGGGRPALIDADSMQFAGLPCPVGHERFLDPHLYGVDLTKAPRFTTGSDWYAYNVLLFQSLLSVHPFGGTHGKLATLLRRAEARHSVFRSDVLLPRTATPPKVLPDDLLHWFHAVFEKDERQTFPPQLLQLSWTTCNCGVEHARAACPECQRLGPVVARPVLRSSGRCTARTVFETKGRILAAAMQGGLRYLYEEHGVLRREDGAVISTSLENPRVELAGQVTWLADADGRVEKWLGDRLVERTQTATRQRWPVLAASPTHAWRQSQEWLVEHETGARVGQVLEGQTALWSGAQLGCGFYRAGGVTVAFLLRAGRPGLKRVEGIGWQGRVRDAHAVFDARHALLTVVVEDGGRDVVHRWLIGEDGVVLAKATGGAAGHAALLNGRVIIGTDAGLVALKNEAGNLIEAMHFPDTQQFVSAGDELFPNADGSLYVAGARDLTQLSLH